MYYFLLQNVLPGGAFHAATQVEAGVGLETQVEAGGGAGDQETQVEAWGGGSWKPRWRLGEGSGDSGGDSGEVETQVKAGGTGD